MATLDHILLNGRPGGGKSEVIDFLKATPSPERVATYHVGDFVELDDFPWLWDKFVEDDLWEELGEKRLYSRRVPGGYVQTEDDRLLDLFVLKLCRVVERDYLSRPDFYDGGSILIEFARGVADGGYRRAYSMMSRAVLERAAILYIDVRFEESLRRNEARYQAKLAHSILAHRLPERSVERFARHQDFEELTGGGRSGYLDVGGVQVPFVSMKNEPELKDRAALAARYAPAFQTLSRLYAQRPGAA